jgi:hypothetical protein
MGKGNSRLLLSVFGGASNNLPLTRLAHAQRMGNKADVAPAQA